MMIECAFADTGGATDAVDAGHIVTVLGKALLGSCKDAASRLLRTFFLFHWDLQRFSLRRTNRPVGLIIAGQGRRSSPMVEALFADAVGLCKGIVSADAGRCTSRRRPRSERRRPRSERRRPARTVPGSFLCWSCGKTAACRGARRRYHPQTPVLRGLFPVHGLLPSPQPACHSHR